MTHPKVARTSFRPTKTKPFAKPSEAAEHNRQQDLAAYRDWLASHKVHPDRPHVLRLVCQLERGPWDTSGAANEEGGEA